MNKTQQFLLIFFLFLIAIIQLIISYQKIKNQARFYPDWKISFSPKTATIYHGQVFFSEIKTNQNLTINNQTYAQNSLLIANSKNIKLCNNCFLTDETNKVVFTQNNINDDIVLKKKLVNTGYEINQSSVVNIQANGTNLYLIDVVNSNKVLITSDKNTTIILSKNGKQLSLANVNIQLFFHE